jgi:hypothetical protein
MVRLRVTLISRVGRPGASNDIESRVKASGVAAMPSDWGRVCGFCRDFALGFLRPRQPRLPCRLPCILHLRLIYNTIGHNFPAG